MMRFVAIALLATSGASAQVNAPILGWIPDGNRIRPAYGIPSAAAVGNAIDFGRDLALITVAPRQNYVLATGADTGEALLILPSGGAAPIDGLGTRADRIVTSPQGTAAALWFSATSHIQIVSGLPDVTGTIAPAVREIDATISGSPIAFAVSDDGQWLVGAWPDGVYIFDANGAASRLQVDDGVVALAFFHQSAALVLATSTRLFSIAKMSGSADISVLYDRADLPMAPVGLALSFNNRRIVLADRGGTVLTIDPATSVPATIDCGCTPEGLFPMGDSVFRLTGPGNGPVKLFDAAAGQIYFAPPALDVLSGEQSSDPLTITTSTISLTAGVPFSQKLVATGGTPPYSWSVTAGKLPGGLQLDAASGVISGTPNSLAAGNPTITVTDAQNQSTSKAIVFLLFTPTPPVVNINVTATSGPAQQPPVTITLAAPYPADLDGTLTLTFASAVGGDDQMIRFSNGNRTINFTIPAGTTQATFSGASSVAVLTGTIAGTITLTASVSAAGNDVTPNPPPTRTIAIVATVPFIQSVTLVQGTGGFTVVVTAFSTTREVSSGLFHFAPATGRTLAQSDVTVQLGPAFIAWYQNAASNAFGGLFTLTLPFTVTGGSAASVVAVTVTLTNNKGASNPVSPQ